MTGSKSDYLENALLDEVLGGVGYTPAGSVYIALYTTAPTDAGGGTAVSGTGYARATVANGTANWPAASSGAKSNAGTIQFNTAGADWGTVTAFAIFDDPTAGNMLYWATLTTAKNVQSGDTAQFNPNDLDVTED